MAKETKKPKSTAVIPWEEELKAAAKKQSQAPKTRSAERTFISLKGGIMSLGDQRCKDNKLDVVILDFAYVNAYYDKPYNPKAPAVPTCYAIDRDSQSLAPSEKCEEPQHDQCQGCPQNEWGSRGDGGQGKACKNAIRLAFIAAGKLDNIEKAEVAYMMVPPTSLKTFGNFYKQECCDEEGNSDKPTYMFKTAISVEADARTQFSVSFSRADNQSVSKEQFYALRSKLEKLGDDILFEFPKAEDLVKKAPVKQVVKGKRKF